MWMSAIYHTNSTLRDLFINGVYDFLVQGESGEFQTASSTVHNNELTVHTTHPCQVKLCLIYTMVAMDPKWEVSLLDRLRAEFLPL